jgi:hypothetical protein
LGIKLKVIPLKHKNIKIIKTNVKIVEYGVNVSHVMFSVFSVVSATLLSISQGGCYYALGCAVVIYF